MSNVVKDLYDNRKMVKTLAVNDFKTKFAGSYFGVFWAFVQPVVTIFVYWFVFEKGMKPPSLRTNTGTDIPYLVWLVAGIIPWFFFQEALQGGTSALIEYSYLVKKVVFQINILPIIKIFSALFVHVFFVLFALGIFCGYGFWPDVYTLQIFYYMIATILLITGLIYMTSAVVVFFRDLSQVIGIVLQVGMWMTPIMWHIEDLETRISPIIITILKLNPLFYIVNGYRDALIYKKWFWEEPVLTLYYWTVTIVVLILGNVIFKRLRPHFADVL